MENDDDENRWIRMVKDFFKSFFSFWLVNLIFLLGKLKVAEEYFLKIKLMALGSINGIYIDLIDAEKEHCIC